MRASLLVFLEGALDEVRRHWPCNLAIVIPEGARIVEADSLEAEEEIRRLGGSAVEDAPARERRSGRGRGYLFRDDPGRHAPSATHRGDSETIDTLAPGTIFVCPPSVHSTGHVYSWVAGRAPWETAIPLLPPGLRVLDRQDSQAPVARPARHVADGSAVAVPPRVAFLLMAYSDLRSLWEGSKTGGDTSASGIDFSVARELLARHVAFEDVVMAVRARPGAHRVDQEYAVTTVGKAGAANAKRRRR